MTQLTMLKEMYDVIQVAHQNTPEEAYDILLSYIAVQDGLEIHLVTEGIKQEAYDKLGDLYDADVLKKDAWDWLGELGMLVGVFTGLPSQAEVELKVELLDVQKEGNMPSPILVQNVWTGRDIFALHNQLGNRGLYFGTEINLRLYRTALVNLHLYAIPSHLLYANHQLVDLALDAKNWRQSNVWNPVKESKLKQLI